MTTKPETTLQSDMTGAAVSDILVRFADAQEAMGGGCSDGYCVVKRHEGMHTNGGCRCLYQPDWSQTQRAGQALRIAQEMVGEIERLREQLAAMHRRAWQAEAALREPLDAAAPERRTLGRVLANAGYYAERGRAENAEARIAELEAGLRKIADAPAWGAPDRWESTPFEVRQLARALLKGADE